MYRGKVFGGILIAAMILAPQYLSAESGTNAAAAKQSVTDKKASDKNSSIGTKNGAKDAIKKSLINRGVSAKSITKEKLNHAMRAQEDAELNFDLLTALELLHKDPVASMFLYEKAYNKTGSSVYLLEALKTAFAIKDRKNTARYLKLGEKSLNSDSEYLRVKIGYYLGIKDNLNANTAALKLVTVDPVSRSYAILAATYYAMENFTLAKTYFEKAYELDKTDENLIRLCDVLLNKLDDSDGAIRIIETHRRIYGCAQGMACELLADVYRANKRYLDVAKIDEALYEAKGDNKFLDDMIAIYYYSNDFDKIIELLKKYDYKRELLIDAYAHKKDYKTAIKMARDEFMKTKNYDFLAIEAIYEYESAGKNVDAKTLSSVVAKFENIAPQLKDPVHLNYYGYILIDHDLDVRKGIELVRRALQKDPDSPYYLDSLAWGYYKLGECDKAKNEMAKIKDSEFFNSPEGKEHLEAIDACAAGTGVAPQNSISQNPATIKGSAPKDQAPQSPATKTPAPDSIKSTTPENSALDSARSSSAATRDLTPKDSALQNSAGSANSAVQNQAPNSAASENFATPINSATQNSASSRQNSISRQDFMPEQNSTSKEPTGSKIQTPRQ